MTRENILPIIEEWLDNTGIYLVELEVLPGDRIMIYIDSEAGVTIDDCVKLSRFVENRLDRENHDFELNVSSAGMDRPLRHPLQFMKAVGKLVEIQLKDGKKVEGILRETKPECYVVELKAKKTNKKNQTEKENLLMNIQTDEVKDVKRVVTFS